MNKLKRIRYSASGFTLIELLIVIVIIGILAGVLLTVINPAKQQQRAKESVLRSNVEKGCLALHACGAASADARTCGTLVDVGIITPPAATGTYIVTTNVPANPLPAVAAPAAASDTVYFMGALGTCTFGCGYNFGTSTATMLSKGATVCLIADQ